MVPVLGLGEGTEQGFALQPGQASSCKGKGEKEKTRYKERLLWICPTRAVAAPGSVLRTGFPKFRRLRDVWNKLLVTLTPTLPDSRGI